MTDIPQFAISHQLTNSDSVEKKNNCHQITDFYDYVKEKYGIVKNLSLGECEWGALPEFFNKTTCHQLKIMNEILEKKESDRSDDEKILNKIWEITNNRNNYDPISRELEILDAYLIPSIQIKDITDLIHRITEYMHYAHINNIDQVLELPSLVPMVIPVCHQNVMFEEHLKKIQTIINDNTTIFLNDFAQNIIEFETEIRDNDPNPLNDEIISVFFDKLTELFNFQFTDISVFQSQMTKKIMSMIFDPMNAQKYRSYLQYFVIKRYAFTCTELIDNHIFEFYNQPIKNRPSKLKSLEFINKYYGNSLENIYIDKCFNHDDKRIINLMINQIHALDKNKIIKIPGITDLINSSDSNKIKTFATEKSHTLYEINKSHTLYEIDKFMQNDTLTKQLINVYNNENEYTLTASLFQPPYYSFMDNNIGRNEIDNQCINFGGIGIFIIFNILTFAFGDARDVPENEKTKIVSMLKKKIEILHNKNISDDCPDFLRLINDIVLMIRALNLSINILKQIIIDNGENNEILSHLKIFFESFAYAHIHNTKNYNIEGHVIKLTGDFWINLVNNLDDFYDVYKTIDWIFAIPCNQRIKGSKDR